MHINFFSYWTTGVGIKIVKPFSKMYIYIYVYPKVFCIVYIFALESAKLPKELRLRVYIFMKRALDVCIGRYFLLEHKLWRPTKSFSAKSVLQEYT